MEFLHKNELESKYGITSIKLPAILSNKNSAPQILIDSRSINNCKNIDDLKGLIKSKI